MNSQQSTIDSKTLEQLYGLLKSAVSSADSESQRQVYQHLSAAQENINFYMGLAIISCSSDVNIQQPIRQMALVMLKSALKRNISNIQFQDKQMDSFRKLIINGQFGSNNIMTKMQKSIISILALWNNQIDYRILEFVLHKVSNGNTEQCIWGLETLQIVLQDFKLQTQNLPCNQPQFQNFIHSFSTIFGHKITASPVTLVGKYFKCMNLLLKYLSTNNPSSIEQYYKNYLIPALNSQVKDDSLLSIILDGFLQIASLNPQIMTHSNEGLKIIINFETPCSISITKKWLTLILQLIESDSQQQKIKQFLPAILPKVLRNLVFSKEDQINVKMEMEQQNNPYQYENESEDEDGDSINGGKAADYGYTRRKLAVMIVQKVIVQYTEQAWTVIYPYLKQLLKSKNQVEQQCGVLLIGIIFQKIEDHLQFLQVAIPVIISHIHDKAASDILRCTSLWAIGKISYLIIRQQSLNQQIQTQLVNCLKDPANNNLRDTVYSTIDQLISVSTNLPQRLPQIVQSILQGIKNCKGKPLYSVLRTCSVLYQRFPSNMPQQLTQMVVIQLCKKWSANSQIESIMSPILQCLVTVSSASSKVFKNFCFQIFQQAFKILSHQHQKAIVIRDIDLISSIVNLSDDKVNKILVDSQEFHRKLNQLLLSQQNQIRSFTFGLIGDICKVASFRKFAQSHFQTVAKSYNKDNLTSSSNALTCLTDLIIAHPFLGQKYSEQVMHLAIEKLKINNLHKIYAFNFARIFGRLGIVSPAAGSAILQQNIQVICSSLKAHQHQKLTDDTYRGIFNIVQYDTKRVVNSFQYLVQCFMCYNCQDKQVENAFINLLKSFRNSLNSMQWQQFLSKNIFLPAVSQRIQKISA